MKDWVFKVLQPDRGTNVASRMFDWMITALILTSVLAVFLVTFDLPDIALGRLAVFEKVASIVFTVEYALRIWTADRLRPDIPPARARMRYVFSGMALVDLIAILPFWLPMLLPASVLGVRTLRLVRLLRILKLNRYFDALQSIASVIADKRRELLGSLFFVVLLMLVASLLMYAVEHDAQPEVFRNAFSGLWWAVATLTTVGYGDIYPVTVVGRILGAFIAFSGIAALAIPTGIVTAGLTERINGSSEAEAELNRQRKKDDEHDSLIREQSEILKRISERLDRIEGRG